MLTTALPTLAANPAHSAFSGPSAAPVNSAADPAPDGFARLLGQAIHTDDAGPGAPAGPSADPTAAARPASVGETADAGSAGGPAGQPALAARPMAGSAHPGQPPIRPPLARFGHGLAPRQPDPLAPAATAAPGDTGEPAATDRGAKLGTDPGAEALPGATPDALLAGSAAVPAPPAFDVSALLAGWQPGAPAPDAAAGRAIAACGDTQADATVATTATTATTTSDRTARTAAVAAGASAATRSGASRSAAGLAGGLPVENKGAGTADALAWGARSAASSTPAAEPPAAAAAPGAGAASAQASLAAAAAPAAPALPATLASATGPDAVAARSATTAVPVPAAQGWTADLAGTPNALPVAPAAPAARAATSTAAAGTTAATGTAAAVPSTLAAAGTGTSTTSEPAAPLTLAARVGAASGPAGLTESAAGAAGAAATAAAGAGAPAATPAATSASTVRAATPEGRPAGAEVADRAHRVAAAPQASARSVIEAAVRAPESPARSSLAAGEAADEFSGRDRSPVDGPARALADGVRQAGGPGAYAPPLGGHAEPLAAGSVNNAPVTAVSGSDAAAAAAGGKRAPSAATGPATGAIQALLAAVAGNQAMAGGGGRVGADNAPASPLEARSVTLPESLQPAADRHVSMAAGRAAAATAAGAAAATQAAVGTLHDDGGTQRKALLEAGGRAIDPAGTQGAPLPGAGAGLGAMTAGVSTPAQAAADGRLAASPGSADFAPQLAAHITTLVRDGVQQARLELNPAEMGPLTVQIQLDGNAARVHLAAENAQTRAALEQAMPQLAGSLRESGLTLSGGGVFEQPRQQQAPQGGFSGSGGSPGSSANGSQRDDRGNRSGRDPAASTLPGAAGNDGATGRRRAGVVDLVA